MMSGALCFITQPGRVPSTGMLFFSSKLFAKVTEETQFSESLSLRYRATVNAS